MREAMRRYFDTLLRAYASQGSGLPRAAWDPDVDPRIWRSPPDEFGYAEWLPIEKDVRHEISDVAPDLGVLHPSIDAYFNSWWFCSMEGGFGGRGITLMPVMPGIELDSFLLQARGYARAHDGVLDHVPIGVDFEGLLVVVDNHAGNIAIEDWERGRFDVLTDRLSNLISGLQLRGV
jgi:Syd protein (SUKH-2)